MGCNSSENFHTVILWGKYILLFHVNKARQIQFDEVLFMVRSLICFSLDIWFPPQFYNKKHTFKSYFRNTWPNFKETLEESVVIKFGADISERNCHKTTNMFPREECKWPQFHPRLISMLDQIAREILFLIEQVIHVSREQNMHST